MQQTISYPAEFSTHLFDRGCTILCCKNSPTYLLTYKPAEFNNLATTTDTVSHLFRFDTEKHLESFQCNDTNAFPHFRLVFHDEAVFQVEKQAMKRRWLRAVKHTSRTHSLQTQ